MALHHHLPRLIFIKKKELALTSDKKRGGNHILSEIGDYKSFTMSIYPDTLDWLRSSFTTLLKIPRNNKFFQEKRYNSYTMWIEKTSNKKGYIAKIFRVDNKGRKCCVMILEGLEKKGWTEFQNLITFRDKIYNEEENGSKKKISSFTGKFEASHKGKQSYVEIVVSSKDLS